MLRPEDDALGRLMLDHLDGDAAQPLLERDDGDVGPALGPEWLFAERSQWPEAEQMAFEFVRGRVLDIGAGAGRHSLEAQRGGLDVVAIDISPGSVEVCRRRGVRDARLLPLEAIDAGLGMFDTALLLCGNFGLAGDPEGTKTLLRTLHEITSADGRIVLDTVDPYLENDDADLAYLERNRAAGRMPGQVRIRIRYREQATPWFDLLLVSQAELEELVAETGWRIAWAANGEPPDYYVVLEKA
jgi:SAM-dependent methyltransferase